MSVITCSYSEHNIRHLQNDDKGMTLLEVLGVLVVAAIVIGAVMGLMSDTLSSSDNQKELKNLQTIATKMKDEDVSEKGIVIGYDRRFLSKEAMRWAGQVFAKEGIVTYLVNKSAPTPLLMYYVAKKILKEENLAEDAVNEAFLTIAKNF